MIATISGMGTLFLYCFFGVLATESFEKMAVALYESKWPDLPVALQKHLIVMIMDMQKPIRYHGFAVVDLDMKTFIKVKSTKFVRWKKKEMGNLTSSFGFFALLLQLIKTVLTYFMLLKTVTTK